MWFSVALLHVVVVENNEDVWLNGGCGCVLLWSGKGVRLGEILFALACLCLQ